MTDAGLDAIEFLLDASLLQGVSEADLRAAAPPPRWVQLSGGDALMRQGERGDAYYLLVHGRLRVFHASEDGQVSVLREIRPGEGVGEMALLTDRPRSATVRAVRDSSLIRFERESFLDLTRRSPEAVAHIAHRLLDWVRSGDPGGASVQGLSTIAIVPVSPGMDVAAFSESLREHLGQHGRAALVSAADLGLGPEWNTIEPVAREPAGSSAGAALFELERAHDHLLLIADADLTPWTRLCARQADLILMLGQAGADPRPGAVERELAQAARPEVGCDASLVLLHDGTWQSGCDAASWLSHRSLRRHHHVRRGSLPDVARLARTLTGRGIGLALGGGGARGLAHIGVLRALQEAGICIDRIGGTSMGSLIAAQHASGLDADAILESNRDLWGRFRPWREVTFPAMSLTRGQWLQDAVRRTVGELMIEDLPTPFFCVSANLTRAQIVVHESGPLWQAVRASGSLPGIGPPMFIDGELFVDGGVLNNLPGDLLWPHGDGRTVVVDVSPGHVLRGDPTWLDRVPSGWELLRQRMSPSGPKAEVPSLAEIIYQTATLSSTAHSKEARRRADLEILPNVSRFGTLQFDAIDEIVEAGYRDARAQLEDFTGFQ